MKHNDALSEELQNFVAKVRLGLSGQQLYKVAKETGLSYPTLKKLVDGEDHNFTIETLQTVMSYLNSEV